jgi:hypothetical protein
MSRRQEVKQKYLELYKQQFGKAANQNAVGQVNRLMEKLLGRREFEWVASGKIIKTVRLLPKGR